jgi:hypothetical protein
VIFLSLCVSLTSAATVTVAAFVVLWAASSSGTKALWGCFDKISNSFYHVVVVLSIRVAFEHTKKP